MGDTTTMRVVPLGTGGFIPTKRRETSAILVRRGQTALLFDAGTGICRLLESEYKAEFAGIKRLNLFLSHYHLDHVIGLTWMVKVWDAELRLFVPSAPLVDATSEHALKRLTTPPLFTLPLERFPFPTTVFPLVDESPFAVDDFTIHTLRQQHPGGSVGYRVDDRFAYVTDTDPDDNHVKFLKGVPVALIDAMYDSNEYQAVTGGGGGKADHGSNLGVASVAKEAGVSQLGLIHINPSYSEAQCRTMVDESKEILSSTFIPDDGVPIII